MDIRVINMANTINNRKMREKREAAERDERVIRARWMAARRADARSRGYRGPLTREEASQRALAALQG
jgi:hypothetical protein